MGCKMKKNIKEIFEKFPKERKELPQEYKDIYNEHYSSNRDGKDGVSSVSSKLESWMHKKVANTKCNENISILEIGAGTLNQIPYEKNYKNYDIIEPYKALYENSYNLKKVDNIYEDISEITLQKKYDKILSIAVFEHILNLPEVIAKSGLLLSNNGKLSFGIPSQGGLGWKLGYTFSTGIEFYLKYKLKYSTLMNYEHCNESDEIKQIVNYFFNDVNQSSFGLGNQFSFYQFFECSDPDIEKCKSYLKNILND